MTRERWHAGAGRVTGPDRGAESRITSLSLRRALDTRFEIEASVPYAWIEAQADGVRETTSGLGDLATRLHWGRPVDGWRAGASIGAFWPTSGTAANDVPATAYFSTGTVDPTLGLQIVPPPIAGIDVSLSADTRLVLATRDDGRRFGSSVTADLTGRRALSDRLVFSASLLIHNRASDEASMEDTGGTWVLIQPTLAWTTMARSDAAIRLFVGLRHPLRQDVVGRQLVEDTSALLGLSMVFGS